MKEDMVLFLLGAMCIVIIAVASMAGLAYPLSLSQEQFDNIGVIDRYLKDKYIGFTGFNGPKDKIEVHGLSEQTVAEELINIDLQEIIDNDTKVKPKKELKKKLKDMGLTNDEIKILVL